MERTIRILDATIAAVDWANDIEELFLNARSS